MLPSTSASATALRAACSKTSKAPRPPGSSSRRRTRNTTSPHGAAQATDRCSAALRQTRVSGQAAKRGAGGAYAHARAGFRTRCVRAQETGKVMAAIVRRPVQRYL